MAAGVGHPWHVPGKAAGSRQAWRGMDMDVHVPLYYTPDAVQSVERLVLVSPVRLCILFVLHSLFFLGPPCINYLLYVSRRGDWARTDTREFLAVSLRYTTNTVFSLSLCLSPRTHDTTRSSRRRSRRQHAVPKHMQLKVRQGT